MIDGHAHACGRLLTAEGINTYLNDNNLEAVVLCGGEPGSKRNYPYPMLSEIVAEERARFFINSMITRVIGLNGFAEHFDEENLHIWNLSRELPGRIFPAYWANPLETDCIEKMQAFFCSYPFAMIKLHQCWTAFDADSEVCTKLFQWAGDQGLPVFIHLSDSDQALRLVKMANRFRDTSIITAHMLWADEIIAGLEYQNVWFDLSSPQLYTTRTVQQVLADCGPKHLILGSDTPYGTHNIPLVLKRLGQFALTEEQLDQITKKNLAQLLGIN